jgi:transglycosylase-like protein with SLT domain
MAAATFGAAVTTAVVAGGPGHAATPAAAASTARAHSAAFQPRSSHPEATDHQAARHRASRHQASQHRAQHRGSARHGAGHARRRSSCHDSALHWWICHAELVMRQHGTPSSALDTGAAFIVALHESGGDPGAYNGWDSNAAAGTPSEGIAQTIGPTFSAYAVPGHHDIWNPVDNMVAAFRYAISRYGSMSSIPGVVAVRQGQPYVGY